LCAAAATQVYMSTFFLLSETDDWPSRLSVISYMVRSLDDHAWSATALEAEAVREGVRLAIDMRLHKLVETDAQEVVNLYNQSDTSRSIITSVCQEIRELSGFLTSFELIYVNRAANEAAHACAHRASSDRRRCVWVNYTPVFLTSILAKDCNSAD
jgi:hypothetical protein